MADSSDHRDTKIYAMIFNNKYRGNNMFIDTVIGIDIASDAINKCNERYRNIK